MAEIRALNQVVQCEIEGLEMGLRPWEGPRVGWDKMEMGALGDVGAKGFGSSNLRFA